MSSVNVDKMKAVRIHAYGGCEQLELQHADIPKPSAGEVLVKIYASAVNPVDWKIREGYLSEIMPHAFPLTLGWDFSGEVVALGENVSQWNIGDAVYARPDFMKNGTYAEYIVVSAEEIAEKPKTLNWQQSAAVPLVTLTAWQALNDIASMKKGDRVLIHAGAGGVGIAAIQLAKLAGATVYTTASSKNKGFLQDLGADEVIDYTQSDFSTLSDLDIVFDTIGGETLKKSYSVLKKGGCLVSVAEIPNDELSAQYGVSTSFCFVQANAQQLKEIAALIDDGKMKVEIDSVFSLADVVKAHEKSQSGHARGKIVLQVQES